MVGFALVVPSLHLQEKDGHKVIQRPSPVSFQRFPSFYNIVEGPEFIQNGVKKVASVSQRSLFSTSKKPAILGLAVVNNDKLLGSIATRRPTYLCDAICPLKFRVTK